MIAFALGLVIGAVVAWNFIPQPQALTDFIAKLKSK